MMTYISTLLWAIAVFLLDLIFLSYFLFGGKFTITLYGPMRFLSKKEE